MRVNLGCGDHRMAGYVNVDLRSDVADVVADVQRLPFRDSSVTELVAMDLLEHFWRDDIPLILKEWARVMKPASILIVRVPNLRVLSDRLDTHEHDGIVENLYGGHRWGPGGAWDTHHWGWTPTSLRRDLAANGFTVLTDDGEPNMTAHARLTRN